MSESTNEELGFDASSSTDMKKRMALILALALTGLLLLKLALRALLDDDLNEEEAIEGLADIVSEI